MAESAPRSSSEEIAQGDRFAFGKNWQRFLETINEARIQESALGLQAMLGVESLQGKRFLDVGCGSGLSSLAARRLGANVHSFDFDPDSVACTTKLKSMFAPDDVNWTIESGSILDHQYVANLPSFDVVYSWGVLHHTGDMQLAFQNVVLPVAPDGQLFIAIYNDQGWRSNGWRLVKRLYCGSNLGRWSMKVVFIPYFALRGILVGLVKHGTPLGQFRNYKSNRGMSIYHDWIDWLGGYPFEVASPEHVTETFSQHGFQLANSKLTKRLGCNEFVFRRITNSPS